MRFEKWQALGNDYLIVERDDLPLELTPERVQLPVRPALRPRRRRRPRALAARRARASSRALRIFNPDGSEAELSGNGAREAILYLRRSGWTDAATFSIETAAGEIRPTITGETTCRVDMGRARLPPRTSPAARRRRGSRVGGRTGASSTSRSATRSARSGSTSREELEALDLAADRPRHPERRRVPQPHQRVVLVRARARTASAPASSSAAWARRSSSGTGASGAAVAHVLRGGDSPVTVQLDGGELEVDVDEALHVDLTGWAEPVYSGELSPELLARLKA